jgi:hypothetical protein
MGRTENRIKHDDQHDTDLQGRAFWGFHLHEQTFRGRNLTKTPTFPGCLAGICHLDSSTSPS